MDESLRVGLCHLAPLAGHPNANRAALVDAVAAAARAGARFVVAPELAVAGYGFADRAQAGQAAEPIDGPTLTALQAVCSRHDVWCATGFLELGEDARTLYNAAMRVGPQGLAGRHRKLVATEIRWMTAGSPAEARPVPTPWGPVGLLICADGYYSGPPRAVTLRGAEALVILATWPTGDLDPRSIWRVRAAENGIPVIVANRTGVDGDLDATSGVTAVYDAGGAALLEHVSPHPEVVLCEVPLRRGRWAGRPEVLAGRSATRWAALAGSVPPTAAARHAEEGERQPIRVRVVPGDGPSAEVTAPGADVVVLAAGAPLTGAGRAPGPLVAGADERGVFVVAGGRWLRPSAGQRVVSVRAGALSVAVISVEDARHPEATLDLAERGVDLIVIPSGPLSTGASQQLFWRCLDRVAVAVVTPVDASVYLPPPDDGAPPRRHSTGPFEVALSGRWSTRTGGAWDVGNVLDRQALGRP